MKKIALLALLCLSTFLFSTAQNVVNPLRQTAVIHYPIQVSYNYTTVLIFPFPIKDADRGFKELLAQQQGKVNNVLNLKANRKDFTPTNLHVYTTDGKVYAFDISYAEIPEQTTFDLNKLSITPPTPETSVQLTGTSFNDAQLEQLESQVKASKNFLHVKNKNQKMKLALKGIYSAGDIMFLKLVITNRSSLDYSIDFLRTYIMDQQKIKRSSVQQKDCQIIFQSPVTGINGKKKVTCVIAVPHFTLADNKLFHIEIFEKGGGRFNSLIIKNKQLLKTRKLVTNGNH